MIGEEEEAAEAVEPEAAGAALDDDDVARTNSRGRGAERAQICTLPGLFRFVRVCVCVSVAPHLGLVERRDSRASPPTSPPPPCDALLYYIIECVSFYPPISCDRQPPSPFTKIGLQS